MTEVGRVNELREGDEVATLEGSLPSEAPSWLDRKKWNRAREVYSQYFGSINFSHLCGLLLSFYFSKNIQTLNSTGSSNSISLLFRRYLATIRHIQSWYEGDVWDIKDSSRKSLASVRFMHSRAASKMAEKRDGVVYVSQWDMAITQWAFIGPILLFPSKIGLHGCTEEDLDALVHFWRGIGYLLGMEDKFNLCAGSLNYVTETCRSVMENDYRANLSDPDPSSVAMCENVLKAFRKMNPTLTWGAMSTYIHEMVNAQCRIEMGLVDWIFYWLLYFIMVYSSRITIVRVFLNFHFRWQLHRADSTKVLKREDDTKLLAHASSG